MYMYILHVATGKIMFTFFSSNAVCQSWLSDDRTFIESVYILASYITLIALLTNFFKGNNIDKQK